MSPLQRHIATLLTLTALLAGCGSATEPEEPPDTEPAGDASTAELPTEITEAVLGEHDEGWFVWDERSWEEDVAGLCGTTEEHCSRYEAVLGRATSGSSVVLGQSEVDQPSIAQIASGVYQHVIVFDDDADAEEFLGLLRTAMESAGQEAAPVQLADQAWTIDYHDEAIEADFGAGTVVRMIALRRGPVVVTLDHVEDPQDPRLDTMPLAELVAERLP